MSPTPESVETPVGTARVWREGPQGRPLLVLGHGAGGRRAGEPGSGGPVPAALTTLDLLAARDAALAAGFAVVRVEQPWLVRGSPVAEAGPRLDEAWRAVLAALTDSAGGRHAALVVGGRSSGSRVACRTAQEVGATAVLALAFPLCPPGRPDRSRLAELMRPDLPRLVLQGERDVFGCPPAAPGLQVHVVRGADHSFAVRRRDGRTSLEVAEQVRQVVGRWLRAHVQTLT